jgi:2'-hydroxyisoflavone reductase
MTVWMPPTGASAGFMSRNNDRAVANGLTFRPLAVTAAETLAWHKTRPETEQKALIEGAVAGLAAAKEAEVLAAWRAAHKRGSSND